MHRRNLAVLMLALACGCSPPAAETDTSVTLEPGPGQQLVKFNVGDMH